MKIVPKILAVALSLPCLAKAAQPVDLSKFIGHYKGTVTMTTLFDPGNTFTGPVRIHVSVPKSRDYAMVRFSGSTSSQDVTFPLTNAFVFLLPKAFVVSPSLLFSDFFGAPGALGTFTGNKHVLRFASHFNASGTTGTCSGNMRVKTSGRTNRLFVNVAIATDAQGTIFTFKFTTTDTVANSPSPRASAAN